MDPVVHFEMPYENRERMAKFYQTVFDWRMEMLGEEMGDYVLVTTARSNVKPGAPAGAIDGGFSPKSPTGRPSIPPLWLRSMTLKNRWKK